MESLLRQIEQVIWSWPLLILIMGTGTWLLIRLRFLPFRKLPTALRLVFAARQRGGRRITAVGALCTALSASIGTGNIVGVATALYLGGPGALLWMELSALTGLSIQYAEGFLAVRYRWRRTDGSPWGGPFAYISIGLGKRYRFLALSFALFGALAGLCGVGSFVQVGSVTACLRALLAEIQVREALWRLPWGGAASPTAMLAGLLLAALSARFLFGGMERISRLSSVLVPLMGGLYVLACLWVLLRFRARLPGVLRLIAFSAFTPASMEGGLLGTVLAGVSRGIFSNEAGLGTAPIAAASAEGVTAERQGLISMTATVFDTLLVCTLTGLVILTTDSAGAGLSAAMTAFARGLPLPELFSKALIFLILSLFAFTTVVGWSCYGTGCLDYLTGGSKPARRLYLLLYVFTVAVAPLCSAKSVWTAANICNGLMAVPNLIGILLLSEQIPASSGSIS